MQPRSDPPSAVRFCPFCGQPLGSFFGTRIEGGGFCCDRCGECFSVSVVELDEDTNDAPG